MSNFRDIPRDDIVYFLKYNNISVSDDIYSLAWNYIISHPTTMVTESIADWILAYNLHQKGVHIPTVDIWYVINNTDQKLETLLGVTDKNRMIRILKYVNKIDNVGYFDTLPDDVLYEITKSLDCKTTLLLCSLSKRMGNFCNEKLNTILKEKIVTKYNKLKDVDFSHQQLLKLCEDNIHHVKTLLFGRESYKVNDTTFFYIDNNHDFMKIAKYGGVRTDTKMGSGYDHLVNAYRAYYVIKLDGTVDTINPYEQQLQPTKDWENVSDIIMTSLNRRVIHKDGTVSKGLDIQIMSEPKDIIHAIYWHGIYDAIGSYDVILYIDKEGNVFKESREGYLQIHELKDKVIIDVVPINSQNVFVLDIMGNLSIVNFNGGNIIIKEVLKNSNITYMTSYLGKFNRKYFLVLLQDGTVHIYNMEEFNINTSKILFNKIPTPKMKKIISDQIYVLDINNEIQKI